MLCVAIVVSAAPASPRCPTHRLHGSEATLSNSLAYGSFSSAHFSAVPEATLVSSRAVVVSAQEGASWAVVVLDEPLDIEDVAQGLPEITPRPGAFALAVDFAALDAAFRVVSGAEVLTWSSARALEGVSSQTMICTGGRSFPHLAGALQEGLVGPLSAYDYLIVVTAARQLACRSGARPPASQARDRAVVERVGGDRCGSVPGPVLGKMCFGGRPHGSTRRARSPRSRVAQDLAKVGPARLGVGKTSAAPHDLTWLRTIVPHAPIFIRI